jgi:hypothetical protein
MKEIRLFIFILLFGNCNNQVDNSSTYEVQYKTGLTAPFFFENDWSYPSLTAKADDGTFDNGYGEKISAKDTLHLLHTAAIVTLFDSLYKEDTERLDCNDCQIDFGEAFLVKDSLLLSFEDVTPVAYDNLQIHIVNNTFSSTFISGSPVVGKRHYQFDKQELILQKQYYVKGDTIKGYLDFQGHSPKFVHLKGFFKVLVN